MVWLNNAPEELLMVIKTLQYISSIVLCLYQKRMHPVMTNFKSTNTRLHATRKLVMLQTKNVVSEHRSCQLDPLSSLFLCLWMILDEITSQISTIVCRKHSKKMITQIEITFSRSTSFYRISSPLTCSEQVPRDPSFFSRRKQLRNGFMHSIHLFCMSLVRIWTLSS